MAKRSLARSASPRRRRTRARGDAELVLGTEDTSLLDIVDHVLSKGVVLNGDLTIGLGHVDLIYARLTLLLCAADRVLPTEESDFMERHHARRMARIARRQESLPRRSLAPARRRRGEGG